MARINKETAGSVPHIPGSTRRELVEKAARGAAKVLGVSSKLDIAIGLRNPETQAPVADNGINNLTETVASSPLKDKHVDKEDFFRDTFIGKIGDALTSVKTSADNEGLFSSKKNMLTDAMGTLEGIKQLIQTPYFNKKSPLEEKELSQVIPSSTNSIRYGLFGTEPKVFDQLLGLFSREAEFLMSNKMWKNVIKSLENVGPNSSEFKTLLEGVVVETVRFDDGGKALYLVLGRELLMEMNKRIREAKERKKVQESSSISVA